MRARSNGGTSFSSSFLRSSQAWSWASNMSTSTTYFKPIALSTISLPSSNWLSRKVARAPLSALLFSRYSSMVRRTSSAKSFGDPSLLPDPDDSL